MTDGELLQRFEKPMTDSNGDTYVVLVYGKGRPGDTWQGWIGFQRTSDGARFETDVETTQPNRDAVVYWASGLSTTYFDGALARAKRGRPHDPTAVPMPPPVVSGNAAIRRERLADLERAVLACFTARKATRLQSRDIYDALPNSNADVVRALEDLEKHRGLLVRRTEQGSDWVFLTDAGIAATRI